MEGARETGSLLDKIKPPRLEDVGLEDCALPPDSIKEAFLKAAAAVGSLTSVSDDEDEFGDRCADDPREDYSEDALVGIKEGVTAPSGGCSAEGSGGLTETPDDEASVGGGDSERKSDALVGAGLSESDGLRQGLETGEKSRVIFGKKVGGEE